MKENTKQRLWTVALISLIFFYISGADGAVNQQLSFPGTESMPFGRGKRRESRVIKQRLPGKILKAGLQ